MTYAITLLLIICTSLSVKASPLHLEVTEQEALDAIEKFAEYTQDKDSRINKEQIYYTIRDNTSLKGIEWSLVRPMNELYKLETDPRNIQKLNSIYSRLRVAPPDFESERGTVRNPHSNRDFVMKSNECTVKCITDIVETATSGVAIGGAIGAGGGPGTAAAGAAAGAIIGGTIGGVKCSARPECNNDGKNKRTNPNWEKDLNRNSIRDLREQRYEMTVNGGRRNGRG